MNYCDIIIAIRKLTQYGYVEDKQLYPILRDHGCTYLLSLLSDDIKNELMMNQIILKIQYQLCCKIFDDMKNIPYAVIKGSVLSSMIYGKPNYRLSGDIDILVSPQHMEIIKEILIKNNFIQGYLKDNVITPYSRKEQIYQKLYTHQLAAFVKPTKNKLVPFINIDINHSILWGECNRHIDMQEFLHHIEWYDLFGVKIRKLCPVHEFISLCMHHYKDMNSIYLLSNRGLKLSHFSDLYYYLRVVRPDVDELYHESLRYDVAPYIYYCLYYTNSLFNDAFSKIYLNKFSDYRCEKLIFSYGLTDQERKTWKIPFEERLFSNGFAQEFQMNLSEAEKAKIEINRKYMQ